MRNEMIGAVVRRAIEHPEFCRRLIDNPQDALQSHGFALEASDMEEIEKIRTTLEKAGYKVEVQNFGSSRDVLVRMPLTKGQSSADLSQKVLALLQQELKAALKPGIGHHDFDCIATRDVGVERARNNASAGP